MKESIDVEFDVDLNEITNETTKKLLKDNPEYKSIFKTLLGSFKSKKPEDYKSLVMSPGVVRIFNELVDKIGKKILTKDQGNENQSFTSYLNTIHNKTIDDLDIKNAPEDIQAAYKPEDNNDIHIGQILSFADFKKKDEKEHDEKEEKKALKSIEDMIKDLQKDVNKIKSDMKETEEKVEDKKEEKSEDTKEEKETEKPEEKEDKKSNDTSSEEEKKEDENTEEEKKEDDKNTEDEEKNNDDEEKDKEKNKNPLSEL